MHLIAPKSYAQYGEDLVLWQALKDISNGFYIDVGAAHPSNESVTKLFYDKGWTGINIEPRPEAAELFKTNRPNDLNLQMAISDEGDSLLLHEIPGQVGLSTSLGHLADSYAAKGLGVRSYQVPVMRLDKLCEQFAPNDIHFLKIDVEGAEHAVLRSMDFKRFRPWLLAIEATIPCTYTPCHEDWESLVLDAGYEFALFHQINRYYVAKEHLDRKPLISAPPEP